MLAGRIMDWKSLFSGQYAISYTACGGIAHSTSISSGSLSNSGSLSDISSILGFMAVVLDSMLFVAGK